MDLYKIIRILYLIIRQFFKWNIKKCVCKTSMKGKTVIVTGASNDIGYETALKLAAKGARTILACRNIDKGNKAKESIVAETGNLKVFVKHLDLLKLSSIRDFVKDILGTGWSIHVLVNSAGACSPADIRTEDGLTEVMQLNHYGPFLLTLLLLPKLKKSKPSRIINVSSLVYLLGSIEMENVNNATWARTSMYANSKRCSLLFHLELAERLKGTGVVVNAMHPGIIQTDFMNEAFCYLRRVFNLVCWYLGRTTSDGAETVVHLAVAEDLENVTGKFFMDLEVYPVRLKEKDSELAKNFWNMSENCVKYNAKEIVNERLEGLSLSRLEL